MTPALWQQVKVVLGRAVEIDETGRRAEFIATACGDDTALLREVQSFIGSPLPAKLEDCAETLQVTSDHLVDPALGQRFGAYRVVRELGRGGMGAVYLAERADAEFTKEVAIKVLKRGTDTDEVLRGFRAERDILARLEHPNIARLLDAGTTENGLPYFVMEYVVGTRLDDYCFAQNLSVVGRLQLFLKICTAVQFAHQNLVIHRDLKPANILITSEGEPKLLDFGIAKLIAPGEAALQMTAHDQQRLTPAYASPEQVRGGAITTVSDVYSLGAVLYELIVGRSPHHFDMTHPSPTELWRVIGENASPRPSTVARDPQIGRSLRGDLDNILLTALRKETARRYSGVTALAEDIRRHLERRTIRARPATFAYTASRFISRNRTAVTLGGLATVALFGATVNTIVNEQRAQKEARRAERHFSDVRTLANSFLFEFHDAIATLPGATAARQLVVSRALEYLDKLSRETAGDAELQTELASAYLRIGDVQGKPYTPNVGDFAGAVRSYSRALEIIRPLAMKERGSEVTARRLETNALASRAAVEARLQRLDIAESDNRRALEIAGQLLKEAPERADEWQRLIATCTVGLGDAVQAGNHASHDLERWREALGYYERALPLMEKLAAAHPDSFQDQRWLSKCYSRIAGTLGEIGYATKDGDAFTRSLELHRQRDEVDAALLARDPGNAQLQRNIADGLVAIAYTRVLAERDLALAAQECDRALQIEQILVDADPSNVEAQQDISYAHYISGRVRQAQGAIEASRLQYNQCIALLEPLVRANPDNVETAFDLARAQQGLAELNGTATTVQNEEE